jgi:hypothetical protein
MKWLCDLLFKPAVQTGEMAPGVPRPTYVLAGLICTEILKNPRESFKSDDWNRSTSKATRYKWSNTKRNAVIDIQVTYDKDYHTGAVTKVQDMMKSIKWEGRKIGDVFHEEDTHLILAAIKKASELKADFIKQEEETLKQQIACDLIEKFTLGKVHAES